MCPLILRVGAVLTCSAERDWLHSLCVVTVWQVACGVHTEYLERHGYAGYDSQPVNPNS